MFQIDPENRILGLLSRYFDLVMLSLVWLLCSLPLVTAGAAATALDRVLLKLASGSELSGPVAAFFGCFRAEWKRGTLLWLPLAGFLALVGADVYICLAYRPELPLLWAGTGLALLLALVLLAYVFPVNAQFVCGFGQVYLNSLRFAVSSPLRTLLLITLMAATALSFAAMGFFAIVALGPLLYLRAKLLYAVFAPQIRKEREGHGRS